MSAPAVHLSIDGTPVPIAECMWLETAPCGCVNGVMCVDVGNDLILTPDAARHEFAGDKVSAKRSADDGFTHRLVTRAQFREMKTALECQHEPKWGVLRVPPPAGHVWATTDSHYGRKTHLKHMVPEASMHVRVGGWKDPESELPALCGKAPRGWWNEVDAWFQGVPCRKCESKAALS